MRRLYTQATALRQLSRHPTRWLWHDGKEWHTYADHINTTIETAFLHFQEVSRAHMDASTPDSMSSSSLSKPVPLSPSTAEHNAATLARAAQVYVAPNRIITFRRMEEVQVNTGVSRLVSRRTSVTCVVGRVVALLRVCVLLPCSLC